jgi:hypothetical protein
MRWVYETLPLLKLKFCVYFAHFFGCVSEFFNFIQKLS